MSDCKCLPQGTTKATECVICGKYATKTLDEVELKAECRIHYVVTLCGWYEFTCDTCREDGWYSSAGMGGPTYHINTKTGEKRKPRPKETQKMEVDD